MQSGQGVFSSAGWQILGMLALFYGLAAIITTPVAPSQAYLVWQVVLGVICLGFAWRVNADCP